ncbi:hypothetical protein [Streptomyces sp. NPDC088730]
MCLSTNCLFHAGYLATAAMAQETGDRRTARVPAGRRPAAHRDLGLR